MTKSLLKYYMIDKDPHGTTAYQHHCVDRHVSAARQSANVIECRRA